MQQELAVAVRSAGWRGLARAGKRRAVRLLAARVLRRFAARVRRAGPPSTRQPVRPKRSHGPTSATGTGSTSTTRWTTRRDAPWWRSWRRFPTPPLISIIFPVYNSPEEFLRQAIDSVRAQLYTKWELCIADDCSTLPHVAKVLDEYAALDERILVHRREANGHISACSNSAVAMASGSWLCLMDHDDVLAEHALAVSCAGVAPASRSGHRLQRRGSHRSGREQEPALLQTRFRPASHSRSELLLASVPGPRRSGRAGRRVSRGLRGQPGLGSPPQGPRARAPRSGGARPPRALPLEGPLGVDGVVGVGQAVRGRCLAPGGRGTPEADRRGRHGHHRLGHQLQPGRLGAPADPAQGQRHHPAALGPAFGPLYRQCPHAHALPASWRSCWSTTGGSVPPCGGW